MASRIVLVQAAIGLLSALAFFWVDIASSRSALLALMSSVVPSGYYAWVLGNSLNATRLLLHGVLKSVLTVVLVAVSIVVFGIEPLGFFTTLALMQLSYLASALNGRKQERQEQ